MKRSIDLTGGRKPVILGSIYNGYIIFSTRQASADERQVKNVINLVKNVKLWNFVTILLITMRNALM